MKTEVGYTPPPDFQEDTEDSLVEIELNDSTELWLIHLPEGQSPDFDGQELSLDLHHSGQLGSLEGSSGKVYSMVSYSAQESDAAVFVSSSAGPRIAGKISRNVSLVHYPEPNELKALNTDQKQSRHAMTMLTNSTHPATPSRSMIKRTHSQSRSRPTRTSSKSNVTDIGDALKPPKRAAGEPSRYSDQSARDSGPGQSGTTISGSSEQSHRKKSKKKTDSEA